MEILKSRAQSSGSTNSRQRGELEATEGAQEEGSDDVSDAAEMGTKTQ